MPRVRLSSEAQRDIESILSTSQERWGEAGRDRYASLLESAFQNIAQNPTGPMTRPRDDLLAGMRSAHLQHTRPKHRVRTPVHVVSYRVADDVTEIVRVLHERMDPLQHFEEPPMTRRRRR